MASSATGALWRGRDPPALTMVDVAEVADASPALTMGERWGVADASLALPKGVVAEG